MSLAIIGRSLALRFITLVAIVGLMATALPAQDDAKRAAEKPASEKLVAGPFVHVAMYSFKSDAPEGTAGAFALEAEKCFSEIESVRAFRIGKPAGKATPKEFMVDPRNAYHVGVVLTFDNFAGMAKYGNHERHNELKKKYAKYFEKIVAYDFE